MSERLHLTPRTYLTERELAALTGYTCGEYAWMRGWLDRHGWVYETDRRGRPIVLRSYHDQRLGIGNDQSRVLRHKRRTEPNYEAFSQ